MRLPWVKKKVATLADSEDTTIEGVQLWLVRWTSRYDSWHADTQKEVEAFASKETANRFATDLRNAFKLIRHTSRTTVTVEKSGTK